VNTFAYTRAENVDAALQAVAREKTARFVAGGTNLIDLMKDAVEKPGHRPVKRTSRGYTMVRR
jgi:xanthine dehydrogenase YagS FAD-binding subunit